MRHGHFASKNRVEELNRVLQMTPLEGGPMPPKHRPPMGDFRAHTIGATCGLRFSPSIPPAPTPLPRKPYRGGIGVREDGCHRHPGTVPTPPPGSRYISHTRQQHIARRTAIQDVPLQLAQIVPYSEGVYKTAGDLNSARGASGCNSTRVTNAVGGSQRPQFHQGRNGVYTFTSPI